VGPVDPASWRDAAAAGRADVRALRRAAARCRACPLWERGTQTVFGEGASGARIVLVGEQPGDREDREGRPFVGPAGRLLDEALAEAGIDRTRVYVTNAVKHFKWQARGKRRLHARPSASEVRACRPWLEAELLALAPDAVVCLGATAARALLGSAFRVTQERGRPIASPLAPLVMATVHPASLLRAPDAATRERERARFVADLAQLAEAMQERPRSRRASPQRHDSDASRRAGGARPGAAPSGARPRLRPSAPPRVG
jgi:DNA polymerase